MRSLFGCVVNGKLATENAYGGWCTACRVLVNGHWRASRCAQRALRVQRSARRRYDVQPKCGTLSPRVAVNTSTIRALLAIVKSPYYIHDNALKTRSLFGQILR